MWTFATPSSARRAPPASRALAAAALALGLLAAPAAAEVILVSNTGPGDFSDLQAAVDAAADGDVLLIRSTVFNAFEGGLVIDGKGLVIQNDAGSDAVIFEGVVVRNLPAGSSVVLRDLALQAGNDPAVPAGLTLEDCAGDVLVDNAFIRGTNNFFLPLPGTPGAGLVVERCDSVSVVGATVFGGTTTFSPDGLPLNGGPAVRVVDSRVSLDAVFTAGGRGSGVSALQPVTTPAGNGGTGLEVVDSVLFLQGGGHVGGEGGDGPATTGACHPGGDGGTALVATGSTLFRRGTTFEGGEAGHAGGNPSPCGPAGQPGTDVLAPAGTLVDLPQSARAFTLDTPVREGDPITHTYTGEPGDQIFMWISLAPGYLPKPAWGGAFRAGFPTLKGAGYPLGFADAKGVRTVQFVTPELPAGFDGLLIVIQSGFLPVSGPFALGPIRSQLILDDSF